MYVMSMPKTRLPDKFSGDIFIFGQEMDKKVNNIEDATSANETSSTLRILRKKSGQEGMFLKANYGFQNLTFLT